MIEMSGLSCACGALGNIGDAGNVVPTASGGGRARLAQRAGVGRSRIREYWGRRERCPDRRSDVYPIDIFRRNLSYPIITAKNF